MLATGSSLIIKAWPSPTLCRILQDHLAQVAARGNNVVVVEDESGVGIGQFGAIGRLFLNTVFFDDSAFEHGNGLSCPVSRLDDILQQSETSHWIDRLRLVLVPAGEQVFQNPFEWELLGKRLGDRFGQNLPQFVVVVGERRSPESSLRSILPVFPDDADEISFRGDRPDHVWWTVWSSQAAMDYAADQSVYCGVEPVLAHFAGGWGIPNSHVLAHPGVASEDQRQNLQKDDQIEVLYQEDRDGAWLDAGMEGGLFVGALTLRESSGNPWKGLRCALESGNRDLIVNIVSQHALLTQYQISNAGFFARNPLDAICPSVLAQNKVGTIVQLLLRIKRNDRFRLDMLRSELMAAALIEQPEAAFRVYKELLAEIGGKSVAKSVSLYSCWDWHDANGKLGFGRATYVRLVSHDIQTAKLDWLRVFTVREESSTTVLGRLRAEHVWQTYMPGQVCVVNGKIYHVKSINWEHGHIYVSHLDTLHEPVYRESRHVKLRQSPKAWKRIDDQTPAEDFGDALVKESGLFEAEFDVVSVGYVESEDHWASFPSARPPPREIEPRHYPHGRVARLSFRKGRGNLLTPGAAVALAQWLNEAVITLLPESHRFFLAVADVEDDAYPATEPALWIVPKLDGGNRLGDCSILIFEDSHSDLGILRSVISHLDYLLEVCDDYLTWLFEENTLDKRVGEAVCLENAMYPLADFLAYGAEKRDEAIDLESLHRVPREELPTTMRNRFTERRHRALAENNGRQLVDNLGGHTDALCDFCGADVDAGLREVFSDGRVRCPACSACGIDRLEQLLPLFAVATKFLVTLSPVGVAGNIDVKLVTAAELAAMNNDRFIPTSGQDARAVGLAISRSHTGSIFGEDRHTLLVESGFSAEETTSTLVHELTHAWQFSMLDYSRMNEEYGKLLIEGHAMWAEKEFLNREMASPTIHACDRERLERSIRSVDQMIQGDSEYGRGYRLLLELVGPAGRGTTPFGWLIQNYPRHG